MARFALRNRSKLIRAFGEPYYNALIKSLISHFKTGKEIEEVKSSKNPTHSFILIPGTGDLKGKTLQFVILNKTYDVYHLAYYSQFICK